MTGFLFRRALQSLLVILGVASLVFVALRLSGDPITLLLPLDAKPEEIAEVKRNLGLDQPIFTQYALFVGNIAKGDLGRSLRYGKPSVDLVIERLPATLLLALFSTVLATVLAVPLGVVAALKRDSLIDNICMALSLVGQSVPTFWLGIMVILFFSVQLKWFPTGGFGTPQHLILPALALSAYSMARIARLTRSAMLDILGMDYLRTARSKGLKESAVIYDHAVRNASISVVTVVAYMFATLVGGAIIVETVFAWPGIGRLLVDAVHDRDYPLAQACVFFIALFVTFTNLITDYLYVWLDPRIRFH